jgi:hypothetical protein
VLKHAKLLDAAHHIAASVPATGADRSRRPSLAEVAAAAGAPPRVSECEEAFRAVSDLLRWLLRSAQLELQWFQLVDRLKKTEPEPADASEAAR